MSILKTGLTLLTVASAVSTSKELYDKYRDKKKSQKIKEVHDFISQLDLVALNKAIENKDEEALIDCIESIIQAANDIRDKSDIEELKEDLGNVAGEVGKVATRTVDNLRNKLDSFLEDIETNRKTKDKDSDLIQPTFEDFINLKGSVKFRNTKNEIVEVFLGDRMVSNIDLENKIIHVVDKSSDKVIEICLK